MDKTKIFKVYNTDTRTHCERTPHGVNYTFISSPIHLCVCVLRTFKFFFLSKFQLHNPVLSTRITMLYTRSPDLIFLIIENLSPFTTSLSFPPPSARSKELRGSQGTGRKQRLHKHLQETSVGQALCA